MQMSGTQTTTMSRYGLEHGSPDLRSVGAIAFGPEGVLFAADNVAATIFAFDVSSALPAGAGVPGDVDGLDARLATLLGCAPEDVHVRDLAVEPGSGAVVLSILRGEGAAAVPVLVTVGADGELADVALDDLPFAALPIADAPAEDDERLDVRVVAPGEPEGETMEIRGITLRVTREPLRTTTVTDMSYVDGTLLVAGASNEEFASSLRRIPFPFDGTTETTPLEIFHVSHGKYETHSPIRTFVPYGAGGSILASYTCTPVVQFPLAALTGDATAARGRTVAELGPMNTPLDMTSYTRDGAEHLLVANSRHPLLKLAVSDLEAQEGLTEPQQPVGAPREELPHAGVLLVGGAGEQVLMVQRADDGALSLRSYAADAL